MDDYPAHSLDHNIPLLVTFGLPQSTADERALDAELREQGILLRSEVSAVEGEHATALRDYVVSADASGLPWNARDNPRKYRFRVKLAGRVSVCFPLCVAHCASMRW